MMKKLIFKILILVLPIFLLYLFYPIDQRIRFLGLKKECSNHAIWIHDRIKYNTKPIDIAFIGSSHTMNAINEDIFNENEKFKGLSFANLGYCRLGRDMHRFLIEMLIKYKKPKAIILEVREIENRVTHPVSPYMFPLIKTFKSFEWYNKKYFNNLFKGYTIKYELLQDQWFKISKRDTLMTDFNLYYNRDTANPEELESYKINRSGKYKIKSEKEWKKFNQYPKSNIEKIVDICRKNNIYLAFLYIPAYGTIYDKPMNYDYYSEYGKIFIPPSYILDDKNNWFDTDHININGGIKLSKWLSEELIW